MHNNEKDAAYELFLNSRNSSYDGEQYSNSHNAHISRSKCERMVGFSVLSKYDSEYTDRLIEILNETINELQKT